MATGRKLVSPPSFTPLGYGLLSVAQPAPDDDPHWQMGVIYQSFCGASVTTYDECLVVTGTGSAPEPSPKTGTVDVSTRGSNPFTALAEFTCSVVGAVADAEKIASDALARTESIAVERAFWTGQADGQPVVFPHLAADAAVIDEDDVLLQSAASVSVTGAMDVVEGLGVLEGAIAECYGGTGVIHVTQDTLPSLVAWGLVTRQGSQLKTLAGNLVAAGAGYPGTSPSGATPAAGQRWMYATSEVFVRRGPVRIRGDLKENIDRATNTVARIAERTYVFGWECCHEGVLVQLGVDSGA